MSGTGIMLPFVLTFAMALLAGLAFTPGVRRVALRWGMVDRPDQHRKLHGGEIPLAGGVAVLLAASVAVATMLATPAFRSVSDPGQHAFLHGLAVSAVFLCGVGLLDDRWHLRGRQKLLGQIAACLVLVAFGVRIDAVELLGGRIELGLLAVPCTLFWLLGAINALNLMDGIDGLAASLGLVLCLALGTLAWMGGCKLDALIAMAAAGALAAFLRFNFPPAKIFLGDAGSMLIGLVAGGLAVRTFQSASGSLAVSAAGAAWAIPAFDVGMAILRRKLTGRSLFAADRCHLHHTLLRRGFSYRKTTLWITALEATTACAAVGSMYHQNEMLAVAGTLSVIGTMIATGFFGHAECTLLARRLKALAVSLWPHLRAAARHEPVLQARLQGTHSWEDLWETVADVADDFDLHSVQLNVNLPALHEEYHANWIRRPMPPEQDLFTCEFPLTAHNVVAGRLRITGVCPHASLSGWMVELCRGLRPVELHLAQLVDEARGRNHPAVPAPPQHATA